MAAPPSPVLADRFASRLEFGRTDHLLVDANPVTTWKAPVSALGWCGRQVLAAGGEVGSVRAA